MPASSDQVIAKSVAYIKNHKISASRKPEDDIKVLLHAILSLEAVTANNSYDINTIVKLLTKLVNDRSVESKSTKKQSAKGSNLDTAAVKQSVKDKTPSKEQATTIINTVNSNNGNNTGDHGLSDLINSLQYIVSK